jgi:hypothetical protein
VSHFLNTIFNIIFPSTPGSSKMSPSCRFSHQTPACPAPLFQTWYICVHLILLDLITRIIFGEEYRSKTPRYVIFSTPTLPCPSFAKISSSGSYHLWVNNNNNNNNNNNKYWTKIGPKLSGPLGDPNRLEVTVYYNPRCPQFLLH